VNVKIEDALDFMYKDDKTTIIGPESNTIILEFTKQKSKDDANKLCYERELRFGNCKSTAGKADKAGNYEVVLPNNEYFECKQPKASCNAGDEELPIVFTYTPPAEDELIAGIDAL